MGKVLKQKRRRVRAPLCGHLCYHGSLRRGVCMKCYMALRRMVLSGETTMKDLEEEGSLLPSRRGQWPVGMMNSTRRRVTRKIMDE